MKDNDAGLISGNSAKSYHLLEKISHMDPKTYDRLLDLQKELQKPEVAQWYQTELLFTAADFNTMKNNVDQAEAILTARKDKGLFLDANVSRRSRRRRSSRIESPNRRPSRMPWSALRLHFLVPSAVGKRARAIFKPMSKLCNASWKRRRKGCKDLSWIRRALMERLRDSQRSRTQWLRSKLFRVAPIFRLLD